MIGARRTVVVNMVLELCMYVLLWDACDRAVVVVSWRVDRITAPGGARLYSEIGPGHPRVHRASRRHLTSLDPGIKLDTHLPHQVIAGGVELHNHAQALDRGVCDCVWSHAHLFSASLIPVAKGADGNSRRHKTGAQAQVGGENNRPARSSHVDVTPRPLSHPTQQRLHSQPTNMTIQAAFDKAVQIVKELPKDGPVQPTQDEQLEVRLGLIS